ncbi:MAG: hypothetical protein M5U11_17185 [Anaerolineales bacterium]|nr:hypothetical protein [Anaerolineales bacterium]
MKIFQRSFGETSGAVASFAMRSPSFQDAAMISHIPPLIERRMAGCGIGKMAYDVSRFTL